MRTSISTTSGRSGAGARRRRRARRRPRRRPRSLASLESTAAQAGAHQVVVVDEQHADGAVIAAPRRYGSRAWTRKRRRRAARVEPAAEQRRALAHARGSRGRRAARRRGRGATGFVTVELERVVAVGDRRRSARAVAVAGGVGERLLQDAVGGLVDGRRRAAAARPSTSHVDRRGPPRGGARRACRARRGRAAARRSPSARVLAQRRAPAGRSRRSSRGRRPRSSRAPRARPPGSRSCSSRAAPAWTRITLIAWPAESCRSRAIRVRSSAAASRRSRSVSRSARGGALVELGGRWRRWRTWSPSTQAPPQTRTPNRSGARREAAVGDRGRADVDGEQADDDGRGAADVRTRVRSSAATKKSAIVGPNGGPTA